MKEIVNTKFDRGGYILAQEVTGLALGTLYSMVSQKKIPHSRLSKRLVNFSRRELEDWLQSKTVQS